MAVTYSNAALEAKSPQYAYALVILSGGIAFSVSQLGTPIAYWLFYALLAALFGSIWPYGTWQWGGWLCLPILLLIGFDVFVSGSVNGLLSNGMILAKALPSACLGSYIGSKLSVRKLANSISNMQANKRRLHQNGNIAQRKRVLKEIAPSPSPPPPLASARTVSPGFNSRRAVRMIGPAVQPDDNNNTALIKAAQEGDLERLNLLVADGADVNSQTTDRWTPLMIAALEGHVAMVETLFGKGAVLDAAGGKGSNALMIATIEGHVEVVDALLEQGVEVNAENKRGWTALRFAVSMDETEILRLLIEAGADVNLCDREGKTALMQAAAENMEESLKALLKAGADPRIKDQQEQTALMMAQQQGHTKIAKLLKQAEAKNSIDVNAPVNLLEADDSYLYLLKEELEEKLSSHPDSPLAEDMMARLLVATKKQRSLSPSEIAHKLMLTLQEAAALSGLPRQHLLEAIEKGELKAQRLEHAWRIRRVDLDDYIRRLS